MSVQTHEAVPSGPSSRRLGDRARFRMDRWRTDPNPIWIRELKQAVRLARTPIILCVLTILMTMLIAGIGGIASVESSPSATGIILFHVYFSVAYFVVTLVGPTVAANGIAAEREGRTWEAVLLTGLEPGTITRGKFLAAYTTISLYIIMLAPVGALPFLFGGVTATETIVAFLFLFLIALMAVAFGLSISSKMESMRGAIAITLLLALPFSMLTFGLFGPGLSVAAHKAWPTVPDGPPIWLPTAYSRAPFDASYVFALIIAPILAVVVPSWFMYEVTIANLTSVTDDRSTGLKRWFAICIPVLIGSALAPILAAVSPSDTLVFALLALGVFLLILTFCVFLFQGDAIGPSRRVTSHWQRLRAGPFERFLGPGLAKTAFLQLVLGVFGLAIITGCGLVLVETRTLPAAVSSYQRHSVEQLLLFGMYTTGFFVFMLGFGTFIRARVSSAMIARLILTGTILALAITPWVVAAIVGVFGSSRSWNDEMLSIASPSPVFVFYAMDKLDRTDPSSAPGAAVFCALAYLLIGLLCLLSARSRCATIIRKHETTLAETDRLLALEDEAVETARQEAEARAAAAAGAAAATESSQASMAGGAPVIDGSAGGLVTGEPNPEPQAS